MKPFPVHPGHKLNVHKRLGRRPGRSIYVLCLRGCLKFAIKKMNKNKTKQLSVKTCLATNKRMFELKSKI